MFLDRDGVLNRKAPEGSYVARPDDVELLPGAAEAVALLNRAGLRTVLVTNQRWLSVPGADPADYVATHARLVELLTEHGARLDAAYHCPHAKHSCTCRKPAPGMLLRAAADLDFAPGAAGIVGDRPSDVAAGRAAGAGTILIGPVPSTDAAAEVDAGPAAEAADAVVGDLGAAVVLLLSW